MKSFEWKPLYGVGDEEIDRQHKQLIAAMKEYYVCHMNGAHDEARGVLAKLLSLTIKHFRDEEERMRQIRYPHLKDHQSAHQEMLHAMEALVREYLNNRDAEAAGRLANFFKVWLTRHILGVDKKYEPYLKIKAAAPAAHPPAAPASSATA